MTDNIIRMPEPLEQIGRRIDDAYEQTQHGKQQWIEGTLKLACALAEARDRFPSHTAFGVWIAENGHNHIGDHDRAALINMVADRAIAITRIVLTETERTSWRYIWEKEIEPRLGYVAKTAPLVTSPVETPEIAPSVAPSENPTVKNEPPKSVVTATVSKRSAFYGLPRAVEVEAIYTNSDARTLIKRVITKSPKIGREIWALILAAIDAGIMAPTSAKFLNATARILFPDSPIGYCNRIDLTNFNDRREVRERILPAVIANKDAFLAAPVELENIVAAHGRQQRVARLEAVTKQVASKVLPDKNETTVVMYGVQLWPRIEHQYGEYDYDQIRTAVWTFRDIMSWLDGSRSGNSPESCAIIIRLTTKWVGEYIERAIPQTEERWKIKKIYSLISTIATLLEKNAGQQCLIPPTPKNEGQW